MAEMKTGMAFVPVHGNTMEGIWVGLLSLMGTLFLSNIVLVNLETAIAFTCGWTTIYGR